MFVVRDFSGDKNFRGLLVVDLLFIAFLSWVVIYADFGLTKHNLNVHWNGQGAIKDVLSGKAQRPMQFRVLIPWLCFILEKCSWLLPRDRNKDHPFLSIYLRIKWATVPILMWASFLYFSKIGVNPFYATGLFALFMILAARYDYGETYLESIFFVLAFLLLLSGWSWAFVLFLPLGFFGSLTKETTIFIPVTALLAGNIPAAVASGLGFLFGQGLLIEKYGIPKRYCPLIERDNWRNFKKRWEFRIPMVLNGYVMFICMFIGITYLVITQFHSMSAIEISMVSLFYLSIPITVLHEIRMWAPVMLGVIPMVLRG